ncbi:MAG: sensor histidine kinase [Candidatus Kariarchaeaceae archaeon]
MQTRDHLRKYQEIYFGSIVGLAISFADFLLDYWATEASSWDQYFEDHSSLATVHVYEHFVFFFLGIFFGFIWFSTASQYREHVLLTQKLKKENDFNQLLLDIIIHDIANNNLITQSYLGILLEKTDDPTCISHLNKINKSNAKTILLTENVNILSRLKTDTIIKSPINLHSLIGNSVSQIELAYIDKNLQINNNVPSDLTISAHDIMVSVFINLVSNSIRYKKKDQEDVIIDIDASLTEKGILISVSDFGQGIDDQMKGQLFERYNRNGETKGFRKGLGLSIIKRIIDFLDGEIWIENRPESLDDYSAGTMVKILIKDDN